MEYTWNEEKSNMCDKYYLQETIKKIAWILEHVI